jgi:hypothetical protein
VRVRGATARKAETLLAPWLHISFGCRQTIGTAFGVLRTPFAKKALDVAENLRSLLIVKLQHSTEEKRC